MIVGLASAEVDDGLLKLRRFVGELEEFHRAKTEDLKIAETIRIDGAIDGTIRGAMADPGAAIDDVPGTEVLDDDEEKVSGMVSGQAEGTSKDDTHGLGSRCWAVRMKDGQEVMREFMELATGVKVTTDIDGEFARVCNILEVDKATSSTEQKGFHVRYQTWKTGRTVRQAMQDSKESLSAVLAAGNEAGRAAYRAYTDESGGGMKELEAADADLSARFAELRVNVHLQTIANMNLTECLKDESLWDGEGDGDDELGRE
ncbi:hypothetical protein GSI_11284 [Ganoderma sinense ZZ0214-1]|uniref:Uncharacterized protein n=1 Tax=Ganoderma sinense ZZ0214-1 TaxID=1077348 RepID=A0A2G8RYQ5_9APHY|nr:hypothetical protein GSI_11284 [Ganoderma sinense ZZ0214-1]